MNTEASGNLSQKLKEIREKRNFIVKEWIDKKCNLLNDYMRNCGLKACVVSVSGGVDSAVVLGLCSRASRQENSPIQKVLGVAQPIHSTASIQKRAYELQPAFGVDIVTVDQSSLHDQLSDLVDNAVGIKGTSYAKGQLRSYMRTPVGYYIAQLYTQNGLPSIVMGTGNFDEDGYLCYFCKAGDGVVDVGIISDIHKSEVFAVARELNVPHSILIAAPSADLWDGQEDELELGFSYDFVELYTEYLKLNQEAKDAFLAGLDEKALLFFTETARKADKVHHQNKHKLHFPVCLNLLE